MSEYDSKLNLNSIQSSNSSSGETTIITTATSSSHHRNSSNDENLDDTVGAANNSIIGKVKSRVSSIIPNSLSKWFSPSSNRNNDSINGNLSEGGGGGGGRRRRRIEIEADEDEDYNENLQHVEYNSRLHQQRDDNSDEESNNSGQENSDDDDDDDDVDNGINNRESAATVSKISGRPSLNASNISRPPPSKRSRLNLDITNMRDYPLMSHQPLFASTPAVSSNTRNTLLNSTATGSSPRQIGQKSCRATRLTHSSNLYGHQAKKEAAYNFMVPGNNEASSTSRRDTTTDIIDLVPFQASNVGAADQNRSGIFLKNNQSSRRSLNIPTTSQPSYTDLTDFKRQSLASIKQDMPSTSTGIKHELNVVKSTALPMRTSTTILEIEGEEDDDEDDDENPDNDNDEGENGVAIEMKSRQANNRTDVTTKYNGRSSALAMSKKRRKLINGSNVFNSRDTADIALDSASESSECDDASVHGQGDGRNVDIASERFMGAQRKAGLFNINASRTSSFGNGLNFNTHLEGRKSLFAGGTAQQGGSGRAHPIAVGGSNLNNSTLSLTSLNRRQFNSSIYSSMSALSDSRLLNTFSPFYKGKTTYGGAAAYNKYTTGVGASAVRITPTLIRPTSSLSTLSSSSNSLAVNAGAGAVGGAAVGEGSSAISSTAKRILDLINDFATPLSEAKKMANNLKTNQQQQQQLLPQTKSRLTDDDLRAQRALRLSQVHTPYMRPAVTLQATTHIHGKSTILPPTRELQVPSMSQLLQMKKMQSTTERSRRIATQQQSNNEKTTVTSYTLPNVNGSDKQQQQQQQQQKHTNKIKNKSTNPMRATKDSLALAAAAAPPSPVNLPNIAFPLMESVPKIDIALPNITKAAPRSDDKFAFNSSKTTNIAVSLKPIISVSPTSAGRTQSTTLQNHNHHHTSSIVKTNFKFSEPLELKCAVKTTQNTSPIMKNYKFSPPDLVNFMQDAVTARTPPSSKLGSDSTTSTATAQTPQLKTGFSVLDSLKKPFMLPKTAAASTTPTTPTMATKSSGVSESVGGVNMFGSQFKKSSSEWECDICMIRNKNEVNKCVACETPRTQASSSSLTKSIPTSAAAGTTLAASSSFGGQFKKSANEWDCDACMLRNKQEANKCVACETPRSKQIEIKAATTPALTTTKLAALTSNSFGSQFNKSNTEWECDTCMIRNKQEVSKCIACETPRKGAAPPATTITTTIPTIDIKNAFGSAFKQKPNTWECSACLIMNKNEVNECIACQTRKPGALNTSNNNNNNNVPTTATVKTFKFGFDKAATAAPAADNTFKTLAAAQSAAKWECEACMTRNDASRTKCVCCEQAKPGTESPSTENQPKFSFGATAAAKFNFGFGGAGGAKESDIRKTEAQKTEGNATNNNKGFVFGSTSKQDVGAASKSFTFGIKPIATEAANKDVADSSNKQKSTSNATTATTTTAGFMFGIAPTTTTTKTAVKTDTTTSVASVSSTSTPTIATLSSVKFSMPLTNTTTITTTTTSTSDVVSSTTGTTPTFSFGSAPTAAATKPITGLSFGIIPTNKTSTIATAATSGFNIQTSAVKSAVTSATAIPTAAAAIKPMFSFGKPSTAETTTTISTEGAGGFNFASKTTATPFNAPATIMSSSTATTTNISNTNSGGFSFGTSSNSVGTVKPPPPSFGVAAQPSAIDTAAAPAANVFGSFGTTPATTIMPPPAFGATTSNVNTSSLSANSGPTKAISTSKFNSFGGAAAASTSSTNVFGSFGQSESKPTATATPIFGNTMASNSSSNNNNNNTSSAAPFVFGTPASAVGAAAASNATTNTTTTWPKNNFVFGGAKQTAANSSENITSKSSTESVFAGFGGAPEAAPNAGNIFGNITTTSSTPTFGNTAATVATSTNIFGSNSAPAIGAIQQQQQTSSSVATSFGGASSPFGNGGVAVVQATNVAGANTAPTFGSVAATPSTFGGFASAASAAAEDGASAPKKSEPAFVFGANATNTTTTGGFNFGSSVTAKPAFNFSAKTSQPTFNFTGSTETQTSKPFQFGATPSAAPAFNFGGGALEATPNAPFQFNAGAPPATSNIFAPTPTPGSVQNVQQQQARRKIRQPIRRLPPR